MKVALAARDVSKLAELVQEIDGWAYAGDLSTPQDVEKLLASTSIEIGEPNLIVYNL